MAKELTYSQLAQNWTKVCYHYDSFERYAKEVYGLTQKKLKELKKKGKL